MSIVTWLLRRFEREALEYAAKIGPKYAGETATNVDDIYGPYWGDPRYNPDLLAAQKGGLSIYKKMREDDQIKAALHLKKSAIIHPGYSIEGDNEKTNEFVEDVISSMEGTIDDAVRSILSAYDYGFSVHEKIYGNIETGPFKGKITVKALRQKSPTRFHFDVDEFGRLRPMGLIQRQNTGEMRRLDVGKFLLYTYQKEFDNYFGESDLKSAYRFWFLKMNFFRYWGMYLEKFAIPVVWGKVTSPTINAADQEKFRTIVSNLQAGMAAVAPDNLELNFVETKNTTGATFQVAIDACDVRIARAILMPTLLGLSSSQKEGSLARSQTEEATFDLVLGADSKQVAEVLNEQFIRPLIEMNFGLQDEYPKFVFKPMREEDKKSFVVAWADAVSKRAVTSTPETQEHIRSLLGFPEATAAEKTAMKDAEEPDEEEGVLPLANRKEKGNGLDRKVYVLTTLNAQEARKAWKDHVDELDGLEEEAKTALSEAFSDSIKALAIDAKKNSLI